LLATLSEPLLKAAGANVFDSPFGLLCVLFGMFAVLAVVAVIGHGIWVAVAAIYRSARSAQDHGRLSRRRVFRRCVGCGEEFLSDDERCPHCGLDRASKAAAELRDLEAAARTVQRLRDQGTLSAKMCEQIYQTIEARQQELLPRRRRRPERTRSESANLPRASVAVDIAQPTQEPAATPPPVKKVQPVPAKPTPLPTRSASVGIEAARVGIQVASAETEPPKAPPDDAPQPAPLRRSFAEWIAVFMEERNILWGELIGGTLIVGCSIALVISLWQQLEQIEYFPFLILASITSAFFGVGFYTLHHWKLESTSRGLLLIGTFLVPLDFLVLAGLARASAPGLGDYLLGASALALFGWLLYRSSRILIETPLNLPIKSALLVTMSMLVSAGMQLVAMATSGHGDAQPYVSYPMSLLPVLGQVTAMGWILFHLRGTLAPQVSGGHGRLVALLIGLGSVTFACAVTICFPLLGAQGPAGFLRQLSPMLTLMGAPILITGTMVHQALAPNEGTFAQADGEGTALWRTLGTGLALAGMFVMFGGFAVSIDNPILRLLCGALNIGTLLAAAWLLRVPALHVPAQVYFATLIVYGWSFDVDAVLQQPIMALRLTGLLVVQALAAEGLTRAGRRADARNYLFGCAASTVLAGILIAPFAAGHPGIAALVLGTIAITWFGANLRTRLAEITYVCALVLAGAVFFAFRHYYPGAGLPEQLLWSFLTHATICSIAAILLRAAAVDWLHTYFRIPLQLAGLIASFLGAALLMGEQVSAALSWPTSCFACCVLAALWLTMAMLEGWHALFAAFQVALGAAWVFGAGGWLVAQGWDWREPYCLRIYALGLGALALTWELARAKVHSWPRAAALLTPPFIPVDRFITAALILGHYFLSLCLASWSIGKELSSSDLWRAFPLAWYEHAYSLGAWLLPLLLAGVLIVCLRAAEKGSARRGGSNSTTADLFSGPALCLLGFTLLLLSVPLLIAGAFFDGYKASASAARWGLAICYGACSLLLWQRHRLSALLVPDVRGGNSALVPTTAIRALLIIGAVAPALFLTLIVVIMKLMRQTIPGPLEDSVFAAMGGPTSLLLPLALLSATLAGHGIRERLARYLFAAGLLANASSVGAYFLALQAKQIELGQAWIAADALLLGAGIAWLWSILWNWIAHHFERDEEQSPPNQMESWQDSLLLTLNSVLGTALFVGVLLRALLWIIFRGTESGRLWTHEAGSPWSWLVYALMSAGACFLFWKRRASLPLHLLGTLSLAAVGVIACTVELLSPDSGYVALMFLSGVYACGWVYCNRFLNAGSVPTRPRWLTFTNELWESVIYSGIAGGLAVCLGCGTIVNGQHSVWSAESILLSACACALLAYQRKAEIWASLASVLAMLASTLLVLHFGRDTTNLALLTIQVNLAVLGAASLLRLGLHRFLAPDFVEPSRMRHLPVQIGLGILTCFVILLSALLALLVLPDHPGEWLRLQAGWTGWLALLTNATALIWYCGMIRVRAVVHAVALGGLLLGVMLAGTALAILADVPWIGHYVLTLCWTLLGLALLVVSWGSHAQDALGPQFWPAERRSQLSDFLRHCFPEGSTRAWVSVCGGLVVALALRATWFEPATPYWSVCLTLAVSVLLGALAIWSRAPLYIYGSGLLFNVVGIVLFMAWSAHRLHARGPLLANDEWLSFFVLAQIISFGSAAVLWSLLERNLFRKGINLSQDLLPPLSQTALLAGIHLFAICVAFANALHLMGEEVRIGTTLARTALGVLMIAALLELWRPHFHRFTRFHLYTCGLLAIALFLHGMSLPSADWFGAATLLLAGYLLLIVALLCLVHGIPSTPLGGWLAEMMHLPAKPDTGGRWFWHVQLGAIGLVLVGSFWITLNFATAHQRIGGAIATSLVTAAAFLLVHAWPRVYLIEDEKYRQVGNLPPQFPVWLVLTLGVVIGVESFWAFLDPPAVWLGRSAAALAVLATATFLYRFVLPRRFSGSSWGEPSRSLSAILGAGSVVLLVFLLGQEFMMYDPDPAVRTTPLAKVLVIVAGLAIAGLAGLALNSVLTKEVDPYGIEGSKRSWYVYLTELLALAFLTHVKLNLPDYLPKGLGEYWYFSVMVLAFAGLALSEFLANKQLPVLATPLKRSAVVMAFLPVLAFQLAWFAGYAGPIKAIIPGLDPFLKYLEGLSLLFLRQALCWLLLGIFFGWLARLRRSANFGIAAAFAVNFGLWVLLGHQEATTFLQRPQLWLIPLGLIVLVAEFVNRDRLGFWPSLWVRYSGLLCIYLSSTFEMFKEGLGNSVILPIVLALLAVAGMLLGILVRVRAFLLCGFLALVTVILAQIWHAAIDGQHTWVLWAFGIILGVIILAMFALFEKHRIEVLKILDNMKRWH
jgi:hypothetical protein